MLEDAGYRKWGKAFSPDSHYEGEWKEGAYIKFVDWNIGGTKALLKEVRPYERIVCEHVSLINTDGSEDTAGAVAKSWIRMQRNLLPQGDKRRRDQTYD